MRHSYRCAASLCFGVLLGWALPQEAPGQEAKNHKEKFLASREARLEPGRGTGQKKSQKSGKHFKKAWLSHDTISEARPEKKQVPSGEKDKEQNKTLQKKDSPAPPATGAKSQKSTPGDGSKLPQAAGPVKKTAPQTSGDRQDAQKDWTVFIYAAGANNLSGMIDEKLKEPVSS